MKLTYLWQGTQLVTRDLDEDEVDALLGGTFSDVFDVPPATQELAEKHLTATADGQPVKVDVGHITMNNTVSQAYVILTLRKPHA